ncbi:MAG: eukaryotic-like serine/threonine-protein kinase [Acidimicrobiaceae bacterium]|nr:eukaryotic-like serine/threonine-protein kinase [Acidimicrobiaceae bacterium]
MTNSSTGSVPAGAARPLGQWHDVASGVLSNRGRPDGSHLLGGRYQLGEVLGLGGVGEVRAGHDRRLHRDVAIKLLRPEMALQSGVRKRFEHEAKMAARLSHRNIVAVFDFGVEQGVPFLVMERLPGQTLGDVLAEGPLGFGEAEELGRQLLDALASAHRSGMLHRDIKPRNVLVAAPGIWKLGDFGIAKSIEAGDDPALTATGLVVGTPAYLPPERLAGRPATVASDIYGVGVVLYQAVSGQSPFEPGVPLPALASSEPWPLRERRPDIAPALDAVIKRAMARDPSARFASAAEMAAALRAASAESAAGVLRAASAESVTAGAAPAAATATTVASVPPPPPTLPPLTEVMVPRDDRRAPTGWVGRRVVTAAAVAALVLLVSLLVLVAGGNRSAPASQISVPSTTSVAPAVAAPTTIASTPAPNPATVASATAGRAPAPAHTDKGKKKKK